MKNHMYEEDGLQTRHYVGLGIVFLVMVGWLVFVSVVIDPRREKAYAKPCLDAYDNVTLTCPQ
jgi:hypothetical protein